MQARNIKKAAQPLTAGEQKDNLAAISTLVDELSSDLNMDDEYKKIVAKAFITSFLTEFSNHERLHFSSALENYPAFFKSTVLPDLLKKIIYRNDPAKLNIISDNLKIDFDLTIFSEDDKAKISNGLKRLREQDINLETFLAKPTSIISILENQGYLAANEPYFDNDLQLALEGYRGTHGNVTVISDINAVDEFDIARIGSEIDTLKKSAAQSRHNQDILLVTNNGTHHFIFIKITIEPNGSVNIALKDSKPEDKISPQHLSNNMAIVSNIKHINGGNAKSTIEYTGEQGDNANCPFYSVREVVNICSKLPDFKATQVDDLSSAASKKDISALQLAMTQKVARKKGMTEKVVATLTIDELGILHTKAKTKQYENHRAFRSGAEKSSWVRQKLTNIWGSPAKKTKPTAKNIDEGWDMVEQKMVPHNKGNAEDNEMQEIIAAIQAADERERRGNVSKQAQPEEEDEELRIALEQIKAAEERENAEREEKVDSENVTVNIHMDTDFEDSLSAALRLADIHEVEEAERLANIAEVRAAEAEYNEAVKAEADAKKSPREVAVDELIKAIVSLTENGEQNPQVSLEEKKVIHQLGIEISYRLSVIVAEDLSAEDYQYHFVKIKNITKSLTDMNPGGWKSVANALGKLTVVPALLSKGLTGKWGMFAKAGPSEGMLKFISAIDELERDVMLKFANAKQLKI